MLNRLIFSKYVFLLIQIKIKNKTLYESPALFGVYNIGQFTVFGLEVLVL